MALSAVGMRTIMFEICPEHPMDAPVIEHLLDTVFGTDRHAKASYALRAHVPPIDELCFVARSHGTIVGTIRFWPVVIRDMLQSTYEEAVLLGPLAVDPSARGHNVGAALVKYALSCADVMKHNRVLLVGDVEYYGQFGFHSTLPSYISLPGGRDARRLLVRQSGVVPSLPAVGRLEQLSIVDRGHQLVAAE